MISLKSVAGKLSTLFFTLQMEQKKWQPVLEWTSTAGKNKCHHFKRDPTHSQQALCSSSGPNLIYLLWRTRCSESHDQGRHGNSLIRGSRGGLTGSTKSGVLLGMIGLHKWLASQNESLWKWLTSLHLRHLCSRQLGCTQTHHLPVVKWPDCRSWTWVILQITMH